MCTRHRGRHISKGSKRHLGRTASLAQGCSGELLGAVCPDGVCGGSRQCKRKLWSCRNVTGGLEQQRTVSEATWVMALAP